MEYKTVNITTKIEAIDDNVTNISYKDRLNVSKLIIQEQERKELLK
jgi:hypothetical protein